MLVGKTELVLLVRATGESALRWLKTCGLAYDGDQTLYEVKSVYSDGRLKLTPANPAYYSVPRHGFAATPVDGAEVEIVDIIPDWNRNDNAVYVGALLRGAAAAVGCADQAGCDAGLAVTWAGGLNILAAAMGLVTRFEEQPEELDYQAMFRAE